MTTIKVYLTPFFILVFYSTLFSQDIIEKRINYDYNQIIPSEELIQKLQAEINELKQHKIDRISLEVHTDTIGSEKSNLKIGALRSSYLLDYLHQNIQQAFETEIINLGSSQQRQYKLKSEESRYILIHFEGSFEQKKEPVAKEIKTQVPVQPPKTFKVKERKLDTLDYRGKTIVTAIYFKGDLAKYYIDPTRELLNIVKIHQNQPDLTLVISGHVCCENRLKLSLKRAKKVYSDLRKLGIPKEQMIFVGSGNTKPLVDEIDERSRQKNRRVEIEFR